MANKTYGMFTRGLRDIKITNASGSLQEDLNAAISLTFSPELTSAELRGDDVVKVRISGLSKGTASLSAGGYSSAALAIMFGKTLTVAGSTPNETTTLDLSAGDVFPSFKLYGMAYGKNGDAIQILLGNCTVTSWGDFSFQDDEFLTTSIDIDVLADGNGRIARIIQQETATTLPSS